MFQFRLRELLAEHALAPRLVDGRGIGLQQAYQQEHRKRSGDDEDSHLIDFIEDMLLTLRKKVSLL